MKVFVVEWVASPWMLDHRFTSLADDPFALRRTGIAALHLDQELRIANGHQLAFMRTADPGHIASIRRIRAKVMQRFAAVAS
jgi:hypothetical protein